MTNLQEARQFLIFSSPTFQTWSPEQPLFQALMTMLLSSLTAGSVQRKPSTSQEKSVFGKKVSTPYWMRQKISCSDNIRSRVRLFADDTILYSIIRTPSECEQLLHDLSALETCEEKWQVKFNVAICHVLTVARKRNPIASDYTLHGQILERVSSAKYLGTELTEHLVRLQ